MEAEILYMSLLRGYENWIKQCQIQELWSIIASAFLRIVRMAYVLLRLPALTKLCGRKIRMSFPFRTRRDTAGVVPYVLTHVR